MAFHRKIQDAIRRLDTVARAIADGAYRVKVRTAEVETLAIGAGKELDAARKRLDAVRREIFERAANPAPQYNAAAPQGATEFAPPPGPPPQGGGFAPPAGPPPGGAAAPQQAASGGALEVPVPAVPPPAYSP